MKLSVSNIAWRAEDDEAAFDLLVQLGVGHIELAPGRIAQWDDLTSTRAKAYRRMLNGKGLQVSSLQAIYFGTSGMSLLGDEDEFRQFVNHTRRVAETAEALSCCPGVFGAPGLKRRGELPLNVATERAVERLSIVADAISDTGFKLCLEPVPAYYGADFLMSVEDILDVVNLVGHRSICLHLDVACVELGGGDIAAAIALAGADRIHHFHVSEKDLSGFDTPLPDHTNAATALKTVGYDKAVVIEMRAPPTNWQQAIETAVSFARATYTI